MNELQILIQLVDDPNVDQEHLIAALECTGNDPQTALVWLCERDIVTPAALQQLEF